MLEGSQALHKSATVGCPRSKLMGAAAARLHAAATSHSFTLCEMHPLRLWRSCTPQLQGSPPTHYLPPSSSSSSFFFCSVLTGSSSRGFCTVLVQPQLHLSGCTTLVSQHRETFVCSFLASHRSPYYLDLNRKEGLHAFISFENKTNDSLQVHWLL